MNNIARSRSILNSRTGLSTLPPLYPTLCIFRAASLNSAIGRGLRRSKGVGFRGKERSRTHDAAEAYGRRNDHIQQTPEPFRALSSQQQMTVGGRAGKSSSAFAKYSIFTTAPVKIRKGKTIIKTGLEQEKPRKQSRAARYYDPNSSFGKKSLAKRATNEESAAPRTQGFARETVTRLWESDDKRSLGASSLRRAIDSVQSAFGRRSAQGSNNREQSPSVTRHWDRSGNRSSDENRSLEPSSSRKEQYPSLSSRNTPGKLASGELNARDKNSSYGRPSGQHAPKWQGEGSKSVEKSFASRIGGTALNRGYGSSSLPRFERTIDSRIPLSIPYTTPASEFLYGTSVVEAALACRRIPQRKHYKLYIYAGENREGGERDTSLERLAKKNGVEVIRVTGDWLRLMDKMSGGRPHNGYILEASPLPRLPITSLGELITKDDELGFQVVVDHQSREEAMVNGTSDFIKLSRNNSGRKPFVLLLDSIMDPGNLGGIIRTASFLGVTAIAISTRNSASFTPVVLKASAGASENMTLFSVNKPAGFIADSKLAGWKVFAAVPPSGRKDLNIPSSMSTDELRDPLSEDPCILMLGGEGEGLRWNLRSKADVDLSIRGAGQTHNVDSLNVSVATGILCNSFLRRSNVEKSTSPIKEEAKVEKALVGDLF